MATFKVVVFPHQKREDGTYNVKIRVTQDRKSKYIRTSQYVSSSDITKKKEGGVEKIRIKNQAVIDLMDELILSYRRKLAKAGVCAEKWNIDQVVSYIQEDEVFSLDIIAYGRKCADDMERKGREGSAHTYRVAMNALERFAGGSLDVNMVTVSFLKNYERFLRSEPSMRGMNKSNSPLLSKGQTKKNNAIKLYMTVLKAVFNQAKYEYNDDEAGLIRIPLSPFNRYTMPENIQTASRVLTVEQIQEIIDLPYFRNGSPYYQLNMAKDVFLLSFALMGINSADMYDLIGFEDGIISYERKKTKGRRKDNAFIQVKVEPEIASLFDRYKGKDRVFSFSEKYVSADDFNKAINLGLKKVGQTIGVPDLNFYYARHSMASICANRLGIDIARVDEMLNHSDPKLALARVYIEKDFKPLWEANRKLIDLFDWSFYTKEKPED